jgi:hypothetical protein
MMFDLTDHDADVGITTDVQIVGAGMMGSCLPLNSAPKACAS